MNKSIWLFFILGISLLMGCNSSGTMMTAVSGEQDMIPEQSEEGAAVEEFSDYDGGNQEQEVYVYVCGYVKEPGVYRLPVDARICDALELAGGVTEDGQPEALNQAEHVTDGQRLYVPGLAEDAGQQIQVEDDGLLNINLADREQLMMLPGIGESKADTILQYREEHGTFDSVEELMKIPGIKEGVFNKIKDRIKCK